MGKLLTNDEVRAIVRSRKPYSEHMVAAIYPTVNNQLYELHFEISWWPALQAYRAVPVHQIDGEWTYGEVTQMAPELESAFRAALLRVYGIEHVSFTPARERQAAMNLALGITILPR